MVHNRHGASEEANADPGEAARKLKRTNDGRPGRPGSPFDKPGKSANLKLVKSTRPPQPVTEIEEGRSSEDRSPEKRIHIPVSAAATNALPTKELEGRNELQKYNTAENTRKNYSSQWMKFERWCGRETQCPLPAHPEVVADYLVALSDVEKRKPATIRLAASAIGHFHKTADLENSCESFVLRSTVSGATRKLGRMQKQARGLTEEDLDVIKRTACIPRRGRGGHQESVQTARRRGEVDIAIVSLMRDGLPRISETAAARWGDINEMDDGTGRFLIGRSKTDQDGRSEMVFVSRTTMKALKLIRNGASSDDAIFRLGKNQIGNRLRQAAQNAGLGDGFSGHSPRVGMAMDLARSGFELPELMVAGRWRSPMMPAQYIRNETVGNTAPARYHASRGT